MTGREKEITYWWDSEKPTLACDLDGTILTRVVFPAFGDPVPGMIQQLRSLWKDGWKIIIWTCRGRSQELVDVLARYNIPHDEINVNTSGPHDSPKIHADVYLDDKAMTFDGKTTGLAQRIRDFQPWYEKE